MKRTIDVDCREIDRMIYELYGLTGEKLAAMKEIGMNFYLCDNI
jgi:hypothetical protein